MNEQAWLALLERVENGTATDEELGLYNAWCNSFQRQEAAVPDFEKLRADMLRQINVQTGYRPVRRMIYRMGAAAAVLALLFTGGMYLYNQPTKQPLAQQKKTPSDTSKIILTLADGSTIAVEDAQDGEVATQAGTKIIKLNNNQLTYRTVGSGETAPAGFNTLQTPRGEKYRIALPDGSLVWLNAASSLRFPTSFSGDERVVELDGEAYFEIAQYSTKPFKVKAGPMEVQVLGTEFNVMAYADEPNIKSTLVAGAVKLYTKDDQITLRPGQQGILADNGRNFKVKQVNAADVVAWKNGFFVFDDEEIAVIMRRIARWYDVDVILTPNVANRQFGVTISQQKDLASVLKSLEMTGSVKFKKEGRKITVTQ